MYNDLHYVYCICKLVVQMWHSIYMILVCLLLLIKNKSKKKELNDYILLKKYNVLKVSDVNKLSVSEGIQ